MFTVRVERVTGGRTVKQEVFAAGRVSTDMTGDGITTLTLYEPPSVGGPPCTIDIKGEDVAYVMNALGNTVTVVRTNASAAVRSLARAR